MYSIETKRKGLNVEFLISFAFSNHGRIIYRIVNKKVLIKIARITDEHVNKKGSKK